LSVLSHDKYEADNPRQNEQGLKFYLPHLFRVRSHAWTIVQCTLCRRLPKRPRRRAAVCVRLSLGRHLRLTPAARPQRCTRAKYDRINALKLPRCSIRSQMRGRPMLHRTASVACPWSLSGFCDGEIVLLICPTCQVFGPNRRLRRPPATLHGVVFDIFGGSHGEPARRHRPEGA